MLSNDFVDSVRFLELYSLPLVAFPGGPGQVCRAPVDAADLCAGEILQETLGSLKQLRVLCFKNCCSTYVISESFRCELEEKQRNSNMRER